MRLLSEQFIIIFYWLHSLDGDNCQKVDQKTSAHDISSTIIIVEDAKGKKEIFQFKNEKWKT